jgi:NADH-quinone oxidoreductase subunit E
VAKLTVLLVAPEGAEASRIAEVLEADLYEVRAARSASEARASAGEDYPDLALVAEGVRGSPALSLLVELHSSAPELPVIVLAQTPTIAGAVEAVRHGAADYGGIGDAPDDLLALVGRSVEAKREFLDEAERRRRHRLVSFEDLKSIETIDAIMEQHGFDASRLVGVLQDIQRKLRYLPQDALRHVAERLGVPLPRVYSVATFYKAFSLKPRGRHMVSVCLGTACHVQGGVGILEKLERELGVSAGEMTYDERFSLESVRCVGCCGLAPVFVVDEEFHGKMTQDKVAAVLGKYE